MTELELTPEERALLEQADAPSGEPAQEAEAPKRRSRKAPAKTKDATPEDEPVGDELPPVPEPSKDLPEQPNAEPEPAADGSNEPGPDHPHALPAQHGWDDPWGQLPTQMRHDLDGNPVF